MIENHIVRSRWIRFLSSLVVGAASTMPALGAAGIGAASDAPAQRQGLERQAPLDEWSRQLWQAASAGDRDRFTTLLAQHPADMAPDLTRSVEEFLAHVEAREAKRAEEIDQTEAELAEILEGERTAIDLSNALVAAIGLQELMGDDASVLSREKIKALVRDAERAARRAEADGKWLVASELFYRLDKLYEDVGISGLKYQEDVDRLNHRLAMVSMYTPERLWEMRNQRRLMEDEEPLPPYNPAGDDYTEKLRGVGPHIVIQAIQSSASDHVETVSVRELLIAGLKGVEAMLTTDDLAEAFPAMNDGEARATFLDGIRGEIERIESLNPRGVGRAEIASVLTKVRTLNQRTLKLPTEAITHEFGNGAMGSLDDFSAIIWPDELQRFEKATQGNFIGVGIHIQLDEQRNIEVVTPLEGTPAHRAGIRSGDIIRSVDGRSTLGFTLNQAVEQITGPAGTTVTLGIEREVENDEGENVAKMIEVPIERARIEIQTVKGWNRTGAGEDQWDWFVDDDLGIGYVRLSQFTDSTTRDFDRAIREMQDRGLNGLILDLRFNPGGLLKEAVSISDRFVPEGPIVSTRDRYGRSGEMRRARPFRTKLDDIPVIALINEGSASASEIVSGAIRDHAALGRIEGLVIGARSFGKGSVQNVWPLQGRTSAMKLTTQYYLLPRGEMIHRKPGSTEWGVEPNLSIEMLPSQVADAIMLRRRADVLPIDAEGEPIDADAEDLPDPNALIEDGMDLQLHAALVLLKSKVAGERITTTSRQSP